MELLFLTVVAFLTVHELDAIRNREWRFFFARVPVSDVTAYRLFTAAHLPAFVFVFWALSSPTAQFGLDLFAVAHALVHYRLRSHPAVEFETWFSGLWIYGGGALAVAHLVTLL